MAKKKTTTKKKTVTKKVVKKKAAVKKVSNRKPISKKGARVKGHSFERKIANELIDIFPDARRQLEYHKDDANGVDIQNTGRFKFQCKKFKAYVSINTIKEVKYNPRKKEVPVLITAGDNQPPMVVLKWTDFKDMLKAIVAAEGSPSDKKVGVVKTVASKKVQKAIEHTEVEGPLTVVDVDEEKLKKRLEKLNDDMIFGGVEFSHFTIRYLFETLKELDGVLFNNSNSQRVAKILRVLGFKSKVINGQKHWVAF